MNSDENKESFSLQKLRAGDRAEFAKMMEANADTIYRLAVRMLNNPQDAEDILQETFIKAFRYIGDFDGRARLSTWLYRIATNEALMFLRKQRPDAISINEPLNNGEEEQEPLQIIDWCCIPEDELMSGEGRVLLDQAVENLPDSLRIVFLLRDIEGLSTRETADVLKLSETAVKTRLSRARLRLREVLSAYYNERLRETEHDE